MVYRVSVDLSAKVEQWTKDSAVVFSDGISGSILVKKKVKKSARNWLRIIYPDHRPTFYAYLLFAAFIYLLIKPYLDQISHLVIDRDYPGIEPQRDIKDFLLNFLHDDIPSLGGGFISFRRVGGSTADILARNVFREKTTAGREIGLDEVQELFEK